MDDLSPATRQVARHQLLICLVICPLRSQESDSGCVVSPASCTLRIRNSPRHKSSVLGIGSSTAVGSRAESSATFSLSGVRDSEKPCLPQTTDHCSLLCPAQPSAESAKWLRKDSSSRAGKMKQLSA